MFSNALSEMQTTGGKEKQIHRTIKLEVQYSVRWRTPSGQDNSETESKVSLGKLGHSDYDSNRIGFIFLLKMKKNNILGTADINGQTTQL